ncbi:uncharacterized protein LOC143194028 [Rhynchophorus ferrugineus]|uniref:Uncharacterized protein n=1 Tax=Rhynchophorus ferrugineus TaxID=354439 RepID=A0A834ITN1_RHYFE|nr:hypothetical protein GWI33_023281 [Rhynchophorus ferrugineus]
MSTSITSTQAATILPKPIVTLKKTEEKPLKLHRTSSIDTIKRINTIICSPQTYILPAMLTTWLKTSQTGLQSSAEKSIFMFRSLIFGSVLQKVLSILVQSQIQKNGDSKISLQLLVKALSSIIDAVIFYLAVVLLVAQIALCAFLLNQCVVPIGLNFLFASAASIVYLAYKLNSYEYLKSTGRPKAE